MSTITKVAVAGATGSLGSVVTAELLEAGFEITALTRDASTAKLPSGVRAVSVDYGSPDSIRAALKGQDAVVSTLGAQGLEQQQNLVDAAIAVGVKRIIPSEFGSDHSLPEIRALPAYASKIKLEEYLIEKIQGTDTTYTIVNNNAFLDWGIEKGFIMNVKDKQVNLFDGGDVPFTVTPLALVAQGVIGVLQKSEETANREVRVHGKTTTIKQILALVKKHSTSDGWTETPYDTSENLQKAYATWKTNPGNFLEWFMPMIFRAAFGKGSVVDFADGNDNESLGVKELNDEEFERVIRDSVQTSS